MIEKWYEMFLSVANKHAPIKTRRVRSKKSPRKSIIKRGKLKKQAVITKDLILWNQFKKEKNKTNNKIKKAKADYYQT